jgi:TolB protein
MMGRKLVLAGLAVLAAGPMTIGVAGAQEPGDVRVGITYTPGYLPGLVMTGVENDDVLASLAARVDSVVRRDLDYSDRFEIINVPDSLRAQTRINYGLWNQLGAVWLVASELSGSEGFPVLRVSLHDVVFGELKEVQAFALPRPGSDEFRMAVHRVADEIVRWATGDPGIAATRIAFRRRLPGGGSDIFLVDSDGKGLRRLTFESRSDPNAIVLSPALSPDGTHLLYVSYLSGAPAVYERNLSTGQVRTISAEPGLNATPVYSPDGRRILLARTVDEHTELFELQREPLCCARRVTFTSVGETIGAGYAPGGRRIVITSSPLGLPHIYVLGIEGGNPSLISRYVFGERGYASSPDWSPQGSRIAYQAWTDNWFQIMTVNPDGGDRRAMTSRGSNEDPSWAPDGRHLVFAGTLGGYHALWIIDTVSGRLRSLVVNHLDELPDWSARLSAGP